MRLNSAAQCRKVHIAILRFRLEMNVLTLVVFPKSFLIWKSFSWLIFLFIKISKKHFLYLKHDVSCSFIESKNQVLNVSNAEVFNPEIIILKNSNDCLFVNLFALQIFSSTFDFFGLMLLLQDDVFSVHYSEHVRKHVFHAKCWVALKTQLI